MKEIKLTKGYVALVDDWRFDELNAFKWCITVCNGKIYARRRERGKIKDGYKSIRLHRQIMGVTDPKIEVDHEDLNTMNCQEHNLRVSTRVQNSCNRAVDKRSTTGFKGVSTSGKRFRAYIVVNYKQLALGSFDCPIKAAKAYDAAAIIHHKEFACLNFPEPKTAIL